MAATHHEDSLVAHQFEDLEQHHETANLGMWLFIAQEIMFFGGLFIAYLIYRMAYHTAWMESSHQLDVRIGTVNTFVLLGSSLSMALCARSAQVRNKGAVMGYLVTTMALGTVFLVVKYFEYNTKWDHHLVPGFHWQNAAWMTNGEMGHHQLFFVFYFFMSGMHALHMVIGIGIMLVMLYAIWKHDKFLKGDFLTVEFVGYYWHFVDIVWVYLFPLLYLIDRFQQTGGGH